MPNTGIDTRCLLLLIAYGFKLIFDLLADGFSSGALGALSLFLLRVVLVLDAGNSEEHSHHGGKIFVGNHAYILFFESAQQLLSTQHARLDDLAHKRIAGNTLGIDDLLIELFADLLFGVEQGVLLLIREFIPCTLYIHAAYTKLFAYLHGISGLRKAIHHRLIALLLR